MKSDPEKEEKKKVYKQPTLAYEAMKEPPEGTCSKEDFNHLCNKGFVVCNASHSGISFTKRGTEYNNSVINIRFENGKWQCAVFRSWDTKNNDYDATFSSKFTSLDEMFDKLQSDFSARSQFIDAIKR